MVLIGGIWFLMLLLELELELFEETCFDDVSVDPVNI
jgi:hypothetical protein